VVLAAGIPRLADALPVSALRRLARLIETAAGDVEEPTVVAAADPFGLHPPVVKGSSSMATARIQETDSPSSVSKENEVFPQNPDGSSQPRRTGFVGKLGGDPYRLPEAPEELTRGSSRADRRHSLVGTRRLLSVAGTASGKRRHLGPAGII
jgi:hypothetical protein